MCCCVGGVGAARRSTDPMTTITDVRALGMGRAGMATLGGSNALFTNPAGLAKVKTMAASTFSTKVLEDFNYFGVNGAMNTGWGVVGLGYGGMSVDEIQETFRYKMDGEVRNYSLGTYSAGSKVFMVGYATKVPFPFLKDLSLGIGLKSATEYIDATDATSFETSSISGFGGDIGVLFPFRMFGHDYECGIAKMNAFSPQFTDDEGGDPSEYAAINRIGISTGIDLFGQHVIAALDNDNFGTHLGTEVQLPGGFAVRAGTDGTDYSMGLGLTIYSVTGFDNKPHAIAIDYAWVANNALLDNVGVADNLNMISFSYLGVSQTDKPILTSPLTGRTFTVPTITVEGKAEQDTEVTVYVNNVPQKVVKTEAKGTWKAEGITLTQGRNEVKAFAQKMDFADSEFCAPVIAYGQLSAPELSTTIEKRGNRVTIKASSPVELRQVATKLPNGETIALTFDPQTQLWVGTWQVPFEFMDKQVALQTRGVDTQGNRTDIVSQKVLAKSIIMPADKTVTTKQYLEVKGYAPARVAHITVAGQEVMPSTDGSYTAMVDLAAVGKQNIDVVMTDAAGRTKTSEVRVLRKASAPDVGTDSFAYAAINDLLTMGAMQPVSENNFEPKKPITRAELAVLVARAKMLPPGTATFTDVPANTSYAGAVSAVVGAGLLGAYPDGTFKPQGLITRGEAAVVLIKIYGVELPEGTPEEVFTDVKPTHPLAGAISAAVENGLIAVEDDSFYPDQMLDRETAAFWFSKTREMKQQLRELQSWPDLNVNGSELSDMERMEGQLVVDFADAQWTAQEAAAGLKLMEPVDQSITYEPYAIVKGLVTPAVAVSVNGQAVILERNGSFVAGVPLELGMNLILVETPTEKRKVRVLREAAFTDVPSGNAGDDIRKLGSLGYLETDRSFYPEQGVTRRELAVVLVRSKEDQTPSSAPRLQDVAADDPQLMYIQRAVDLGYFTVSANYFMPNTVVSRGEAAAILAAFQGLTVPQAALTRKPFADVPAEHPYAKAIATALQAGIILPAEQYFPDEPLTRQDLVDMLMRTAVMQSRMNRFMDWNGYDINKTRAPVLPRKKTAVIDVPGRTAPRIAEAADEETSDTYLRFAPPMEAQMQQGVIYPRTADSVGVGTPLLSIISPKDLFVTTRADIDVAGVATNGGPVQVNGNTVALNQKGAFQTRTGLKPGKNVITVVSAGATEKRRVLRLFTYNDISGIPQKKVIEYLATLGYFAEGTQFYPSKAVARDELVTIALKAGGVRPGTPLTQSYSDVPLSYWAAPSIYAAADAGIIEKKNTFQPQSDVTRGEAVAILLKALKTGIPQGALKAPVFTDVPITHPYANAIAVAMSKGIVARTDRFQPDMKLTRADLAVWLVNTAPVKEQIVQLRDFKNT